jgi:hypothetical protein
VHWLQELSVLQSWRWRRQWPVYQQSITDLYDTVTASGSSSRAFSILYSDEAVLTTRNLPNLQRIPMPNKRHFTLLEEPVSRHRLIQWFQTELG